jgi:hypothetical protein
VPRESRGSAYGAIEQPYPGLRPFRETEQAIFFGRSGQIGEILRRLRQSHLAAIVGGSGSGKSSLIRAGVIPELRARGLSDSGDFWLIADFTPKDQALDNLAKALAPLLERGERSEDEHWRSVRQGVLERNSIGAFFEANRNRVVLEEGQPDDARSIANLLIICDQFEEIFRNWQDPVARRQADSLVNLLVGAYEGREKFARLFVIIGMRSDDLHRTTNYIKLPSLINASSYLTRRLDTGEVAAAIIEPMRFAIRTLFRENKLRPPAYRPIAVDSSPFEPEVMRRLYDEVANFAHDPDHLPLLQHLLSVIWEHVKGRFLGAFEHGSAAVESELRITVDDLVAATGFPSIEAMDRFASSGGGMLLGRALDREADRAWNANPDDRGVAEYMFRLLASVDNRGSYKRRWTTRREIREVAGTTPGRVEAVIAAFTSPYPFLNVAGAGDEDKIDVSHESFIRQWSRFVSWLKAEHELAAAFVSLEKGYEAWRDSLSGVSTPRRYLRLAFGRLTDDHLATLEDWCRSRSRNDAWSKRYEKGTDEEQEAPLHSDAQPKAAVPLATLRSFYWRSRWLGRGRRWSPAAILVLLPVLWLLFLILWMASVNQDAYRTFALANEITSPSFQQDENSAFRLWEAAMNLEALDVVEDNWRHPLPTLRAGRRLVGKYLKLVTYDGYELASETADRAARLKSATLIWPADAAGQRASAVTPVTSWPGACRANPWSSLQTMTEVEWSSPGFAKADALPTVIHRTPAPGEARDGAQIALLRSAVNENLYALFSISRKCEPVVISAFSIAPGSTIKFDRDLSILAFNTKVLGENGTLKDNFNLIRVRLVRQCPELGDGKCEAPSFVGDIDPRFLEVPVGAPYEVTESGFLVDVNNQFWATHWLDKPRMLTPDELLSLANDVREPNDLGPPLGMSPTEPGGAKCTASGRYVATLRPDTRSSQFRLEVFQNKYGDDAACGDDASNSVRLLRVSFISSRLKGLRFGAGDDKGYVFLYGDEPHVIYKLAWARKVLLRDLCGAIDQWWGPAAWGPEHDYLPGRDQHRYPEDFVKRADAMSAVLASVARCRGTVADPAMGAAPPSRN